MSSGVLHRHFWQGAVMPCFCALKISKLKIIYRKMYFLVDLYLVVNTEICIFASYKNKETMTAQEQIQNELGQEIKNIKEHEGFLIFDCEDGIRRSNKLTKTGKHKKGSVRVW